MTFMMKACCNWKKESFALPCGGGVVGVVNREAALCFGPWS